MRSSVRFIGSSQANDRNPCDAMTSMWSMAEGEIQAHEPYPVRRDTTPCVWFSASGKGRERAGRDCATHRAECERSNSLELLRSRLRVLHSVLKWVFSRRHATVQSRFERGFARANGMGWRCRTRVRDEQKTAPRLRRRRPPCRHGQRGPESGARPSRTPSGLPSPVTISAARARRANSWAQKLWRRVVELNGIEPSTS